MDPALEHGKELVHRLCGFARPLRYRFHTRKHVLYAVVELRDQKGLVILGMSAFGNIDVDAKLSIDTTKVIVRDAGSCFDPAHCATGSNNSEVIDELRAPFSVCLAALGEHARLVLWMDTRAPFGCGHLKRALR